MAAKGISPVPARLTCPCLLGSKWYTWDRSPLALNPQPSWNKKCVQVWFIKCTVGGRFQTLNIVIVYIVLVAISILISYIIINIILIYGTIKKLIKFMLLNPGGGAYILLVNYKLATKWQISCIQNGALYQEIEFWQKKCVGEILQIYNII